MTRSHSLFGTALAALALGSLVAGCGSSVDGLFTSGGAPNASGGSGVSASGSVAVGGHSATGGSSSIGGSTITNGGSSAVGGSASIGGTSSVAGSGSVGGGSSVAGSGMGGRTSTGGDASTGGNAGTGMGGGMNAGGSGGSNAAGSSSGGTGGSNGGSSGAGGSGDNLSCQELQSLASDELTAARACDNSHNAEQCTGKVSTTCGCQVPVESADSDATKAYLATLKRFQNKGCSIACTALVCLPIQRAECQSQGPSSGGVCVAVTGPVTQ